MQQFRFGWLLLALVMAGGIFWSCDRLDGEVTGNQPPVAEFVNVPLDSSQFSYAPTVYWTGHDPDGFVTAFQYRDDASPAAVDSYRVDGQPGHEHALESYIATVSETSWVTTDSTQETIYLLTDEGDTTEHVFMIRSVDDRGAVSPVRVRIFFRTNQAPNTPEVKKVSLPLEEDQEFAEVFTVVDTLFIGDYPTATWGGLQFLWRGTDPDSRELNIIPLEYSYRLKNETTGQFIPFLRIIDSVNVEFVDDWSDWSSAAQTSYFGVFPFMETGNYRFEVRVRDDGLTESDTNAVATFYAIRPSFAKQLLVVDENKPLSGAEGLQGGLNDQVILDFYYSVLPEVFQLSEQLRPLFLPDLNEPFVYDTSEGGTVAWFRNKTGLNTIPYSLIHQFKWIWIIDDDNSSVQNPANTPERQRVMAEYMDVGGQVQISGRRIFTGSYGIDGDVANMCGHPNGAFFCDYFNLQSASSKPRAGANPAMPDFAGATTNNQYLPQLNTNTALCSSLTWGTQHLPYLPEIDYYGRDNTVSGYDYSQTMYNYRSSTVGDTFGVTGADCDVATSTATQAFLLPLTGHDRLLSASRVYNRSRNVYGEFMYIYRPYDGNGLPQTWQIVVSTPFEAGAWTSDDTLEVDYSYIPIAANHDKPVATQYLRMEGTVEIDFQTGEFTFIGYTLFRSSIFAFPFAFMDTTHVDVPVMGSVNPVTAVLANQLLYFNSPREIIFEQGDQ